MINKGIIVSVLLTSSLTPIGPILDRYLIGPILDHYLIGPILILCLIDVPILSLCLIDDPIQLLVLNSGPIFNLCSIVHVPIMSHAFISALTI